MRARQLYLLQCVRDLQEAYQESFQLQPAEATWRFASNFDAPPTAKTPTLLATLAVAQSEAHNSSKQWVLNDQEMSGFIR